MANFNKAIHLILEHEGYNLTNRADDAGGLTHFGITKPYAKAHGYNGRIEDLTLNIAKELYKHHWDFLHLDLVDSQDVALEIFDTAVNCGDSFAVKSLQTVLNVLNRYQKDWYDLKVDGAFGRITLQTLNTATKKRRINILKALNCLQGARYIKLAENPDRRDEMNINGWFNHRINLGG
jgi:lysozyme family protein